jgi:Ser/Thr protein kinase RdoA (MazF antagonist)
VHGCSDDFEERGERPPFDLDLLLDRPLAILVPVLGRASADSRDVSRIVGRLRRQLATAAENGLDWGPCHGDFSAGNFHLSDGDRVGIFDFDFCGPGWRSSDLAHVQWTALFQGRQSTWTSFLDGYVSTRPLSRPDIDAIPLFHVARRLYFLSLHLVNATAWGAGHNTGRYVRSEVAFFRSWEADELPAWIRG